MPVGHGRYMSDRIPGAKLVELPGKDHVPFVGDADAVVDEIQEFLTGPSPRSRTEPRSRHCALHGHSGLDAPCSRARGPCLAGCPQLLLRAGSARAGATPGPRAGHCRRRLSGQLRRPRPLNPLRLIHQSGGRAPDRQVVPSRAAAPQEVQAQPCWAPPQTGSSGQASHSPALRSRSPLPSGRSGVAGVVRELARMSAGRSGWKSGARRGRSRP